MPEFPDWFRDVAEYMLREGLPETLRLAAISVTASLVVGVLLGTLITLQVSPNAVVDPALHRGLAGVADPRHRPLHLLAPGVHDRGEGHPAERLHVGGRSALTLG